MDYRKGRDETELQQAYLIMQIGVICILLFLVASVAVAEHPNWFQ